MTINKKTVIGIIVAVILVFGGIIGWAIFQKGKTPSEKEVIPGKEETVIEKQLRELKELRGEVQPMTQEEIQKQLEELEKLR